LKAAEKFPDLDDLPNPTLIPSKPLPIATVQIGIDFGNTCSGYASSLDGQAPLVHTEYGEHHTHVLCKTPTLILYHTTCKPWQPLAFGSKAEHL
jgi:hypothetical protein